MEAKKILELKEARLRKLEGSDKNIKCGGAIRKLKREIRNLKLALDK